jgi:anti-sigma factor (TIGR02949 family)
MSPIFTDRIPEVKIMFPADCEETVRALWDYLDRSLDRPQMDAIDAHLARCDGCREHFDFERVLVDRIRDLRRDHDDAAALRVRILAVLRDAGLSRR